MPEIKKNYKPEDPLTIVFMNSIGKDVWRGGEKWMVNAAAGLHARGNRVFCIGKKNAVWLSKASARGLETVGMNIHSDFDPFVISKLYSFFKKNKVTVVCCNFEKDVRLGGIAARFAGVNSIFVRKGLSLLYEKMRYRLAYKHIVDHIITPAFFIKQQFEQFKWLGQERIHVVHNGVELPDTSEFDRDKILSIGSSVQRPVLFGAGSLFWQKGFEYLIEAIKLLNDRGLFPHAVIAGAGDPEPYRKLAIQFGVKAYIHFAGHRNDVQELMYGADCFVLSSIDEGLPNVVLEAMGVGTPVVAADAGGTNEIITDGVDGFIVPVKDSHALAEKLEPLLRDPLLRKSIGKNGFETVKNKFSIQCNIDGVESLFRWALKNENTVSK
jgi:glycosyltransferase involved in cell wall biosynthesis